MTKNVKNPDIKIDSVKRKNGHKISCKCHICENIKNKVKRGGYEDDLEKEELKRMGGSKKKNGHKPECKCIICKNMKKSKKQKAGSIEDDDSSSDDDDLDNNSINDEDENEEEIELNENEIDVNGDDIEDNSEIIYEEQMGGKKKKINKKSNGHKLNCKCPICKNINKKLLKGGEEPDIENQLGDEEEGGIKAEKDLSENEIKASDNEYDELDAAERGEIKNNEISEGGG